MSRSNQTRPKSAQRHIRTPVRPIYFLTLIPPGTCPGRREPLSPRPRAPEWPSPSLGLLAHAARLPRPHPPPPPRARRRALCCLLCTQDLRPQELSPIPRRCSRPARGGSTLPHLQLHAVSTAWNPGPPTPPHLHRLESRTVGAAVPCLLPRLNCKYQCALLLLLMLLCYKPNPNHLRLV
jgi:hypothetical protein